MPPSGSWGSTRTILYLENAIHRSPFSSSLPLEGSVVRKLSETQHHLNGALWSGFDKAPFDQCQVEIMGISSLTADDIHDYKLDIKLGK